MNNVDEMFSKTMPFILFCGKFLYVRLLLAPF